ncbi:MAG: FAD-binding oxidoreductase [Thermoplasmatales archaeon]|nr:FAD-binding oxidoreductase [Thermoplasmatales archaeon]MCW6170746.1 FAD-binding oxidoreductase [Thermoplasmatales archaeon]
MATDVYSLWGNEKNNFRSNKTLYDYVFDRLKAGNNAEWDGNYTVDELETNDELKKLLGECLPIERISFDARERFSHSVGKSAMEFASLIDRKNVRIVDAVIYPLEDEIECVFNKLSRMAEIIPFGGGTSVTGGLIPEKSKKYTVSLDTENINYFNVDKKSMTLEAGAGLKGPDIENRLQKIGLTLGNFPESFEYSTLGGWIATNAAGQESNRYGKIKDMVIGIKLVSPRGTFVDHPVPAESAFFRVSDIGIGSEGVYGIVTRAWLRVHKVPEKLYFRSYMFRSFGEGLEQIRNEFINGNYGIVARLSDEQETLLSLFSIRDTTVTRIFKFYLKKRHVLDRGSLLVIMDDKKIDFSGGIYLGSTPAKIWYRTRYDRPYLYNDLLKHGIIAETIETSIPWSKALDLYNSVIFSFNNEAKRLGVPTIIMCHASHEYISGTALYFTFLFYSKNNKEEILLSLRETILKTMMLVGASISHHHGIGQYLSEDLKKYKGSSYELIRSLKQELDPDNTLNPGIIK